MASGIQGTSGISQPNIAAIAKAKAAEKAKIAAKKKADKKAAKQLKADAGGQFAVAMGDTMAGLYKGDGTPIALTGRLLYQGKEITANELINKFYYWKPGGPEEKAFDAKLKSLRIVDPTRPIGPDERKAYYVGAVARASQFYAISKGTNPDAGSFEGTLASYKGQFQGPSTEPNLPSRSINNLTDAAINAIIDQVSQAKLRKDITDPNERAKLIKQVKALVQQGTVTTTKKIKNPTTGKLENVTETSGPGIEDIQLQLGQDLQTSHADDYKLNKTLEFGNDLMRLMSRGV